ncbi:hypothetical protein AMTR_s00054p00056540 [Amborella trichopoda]|uniref:Uncharacterized protein n=1 Tax=Amborella trichopoda TaxID=13333 RepID=U5D7D5_AMBTC|nr:hypothetical protein AMTR_s00054p00056540 [Amborella trichopoda]
MPCLGHVSLYSTSASLLVLHALQYKGYLSYKPWPRAPIFLLREPILQVPLFHKNWTTCPYLLVESPYSTSASLLVVQALGHVALSSRWLGPSAPRTRAPIF